MHVPGELVSDLKSSDEDVSKQAMEKADCFIAALEEPCRTKINKTRINTTPSCQDSLVKSFHAVSQELRHRFIYQNNLMSIDRNMKETSFIIVSFFSESAGQQCR